MTLDQPVREAVRDALDVEIVPDEVVRAVEGDEELRLLADARYRLHLADGPDADTGEGLRRDAYLSTDALVKQRLRQLLDAADVDGREPA